MATGATGNMELLSVLVVEDNAFTSMTVRKTLQSLGVGRISAANNGREALEFLDSEDAGPDVILMDLRMPGMGGLELMGRLKDRRYTGHVVVTSGVDEETMNAVRNTALDSNINVLGFLPKPLTAKVLGELLARAC
jgi:CheY-like chemotaxis protein